MGIFHRRIGDDGRPVAPAVEPKSSPRPPGLSVLLSPGLAEVAPALAPALGPGFAVMTDQVVGRGIMVSGPVGPIGVAFLRASYPGVGLLIVDRRWPSRRPAEAVVHLEAGADGYLASPTVAELASHIQALARRMVGEAHAA
jgi:hypothetical protein